MKCLALILTLLPDASGPVRERSHPLASEKLGSAYVYLRSGTESGLEVEFWWNSTLDRNETWYKPSGEYWLKIDARTFVRGVNDDPEGWRTDPSRCLVLRSGRWNRRIIP